MVKLTGHSFHKICMPSKPIPKGYKLLALCKHGYIWAFLLTLRVNNFMGFEKHYKPQGYEYPAWLPIKLRTISRAVFYLCSLLPFVQRRFILFYDNYFTNIPLFLALAYYGIAACGTAHPNSAVYPAAHKINKRRTRFSWGFISSIEIKRVCCIIWQDKTLVRFMTTAFNPQFYAKAWRRRPTLPKNRNAYRELIGKVSCNKHID